MVTELPILAVVEQLRPNIIRVLGGNPGNFTLQGTNTYVIGTGTKRLLIDTGEGKASWYHSMGAVLQSGQFTISHVLLTHWHHDHVDGCADLLSLAPQAAIYKHKGDQFLAPKLLEPAADPVHDIYEGQIFEVEGARIRALLCPGHTRDHSAFILESDASNRAACAIFTGDNVLGHGTAVFESLPDYLSSLQLMYDAIQASSLEQCSKTFTGPKPIALPVIAYPAHGAPIADASTRIMEYLRHRQERESQVMKLLQDASSHESTKVTALSLAKSIYAKYPSSLLLPAAHGILQILQKLEGQGIVLKRDYVKEKVSESDFGITGSTWILSNGLNAI